MHRPHDDFGYLTQRLDRADFVAGVHDGDQHCPLSQCFGNGVGRNVALFVDGQISRAKARVSRKRAVLLTASCSICVVTRWSPRPRFASRTPTRRRYLTPCRRW